MISSYSNTGDQSPLILVVGDFRTSPPAAHLQDMSGMAPVDFSELEMALRRFGPDIVVSALVTRRFDAADIVVILRKAKFSGRYRILVDAIENPQAVLGDLLDLAPGLDVDFLIIERG